MFRLYGNDNGMKLLDVSHDEFDIVDTLGSYIGIYDEINYIVVENDGKSDGVKEHIRNYNEYLSYKHSVYEKYKEELKGFRECKIEQGYIKKLTKKHKKH